MRKLHFTDPELKNFALRGTNAIRGGMELLHVHIKTGYNSFGSFATRMDSLTQAYELPAHVIHKMITGGDSERTEMQWVYFINKYGSVRPTYLADSGVIPYVGSGGSSLNDANFLLDLGALRKFGIEVDY
ncbi:hypothetical protein SEA_PHREDRICK_259 [Streptomyces phage Phredrick]|nr:hypothetical protein SEA_EMMA1919_254 [Streptomyces phage Emma1919]WNN94812.1 hypothetical protein SEA_PHREDRICK_259 [Streptomyces phage Phredrick]